MKTKQNIDWNRYTVRWYPENSTRVYTSSVDALSESHAIDLLYERNRGFIPTNIVAIEER